MNITVEHQLKLFDVLFPEGESRAYIPVRVERTCSFYSVEEDRAELIDLLDALPTTPEDEIMELV